MMSLVQQVLGAWPKGTTSAALAIALAGLVAGLFLWLAGSRFSQSLITLLAVGAGTLIGLRLPHWLDWPIASWATAVGAALLLGVCGYAMHQLWAGIGLALLLATWSLGAVITTYGLADALKSVWPSGAGGAGIVYQVRELWSNLPSELRRVGPFTCGVALAAGLCLALMWSRIAAMLLYSVLGVTMLAGFGMATAIISAKPSILRIFPSAPTTQWSAFAGMVLVGVLAQWSFLRRPAAESPPQLKKGPEDVPPPLGEDSAGRPQFD